MNNKNYGDKFDFGCNNNFRYHFCCFYILRFREHQVFSNEVKMTVSSISYAGYNLITTGAILAGMSRFAGQERCGTGKRYVRSGAVCYDVTYMDCA